MNDSNEPCRGSRGEADGDDCEVVKVKVKPKLINWSKTALFLLVGAYIRIGLS